MSDPSKDLSDQVKRQMNQPQIHDEWEKNYRSPDNERFFEQAYDRFVGAIAQKPGSLALDIGCGLCANSIRLARRGYNVVSADYGESILERAHENVARNRLSERISIQREDILNLSFPDSKFDLVLCWGVLMHIPDISRAISELIRVTKPSGFIVLEEVNQNAPEARMMRMLWSRPKAKIAINKTDSGYEQTTSFEGEKLFWRHVDIDWLTKKFGMQSCRLFRRESSMASELYILTPSQFLKGAVQGWNRFWERHINIPALAMHNVLVFQKEPTNS